MVFRFFQKKKKMCNLAHRASTTRTEWKWTLFLSNSTGAVAVIDIWAWTLTSVSTVQSPSKQNGLKFILRFSVNVYLIYLFFAHTIFLMVNKWGGDAARRRRCA